MVSVGKEVLEMTKVPCSIFPRPNSQLGTSANTWTQLQTQKERTLMFNEAASTSEIHSLAVIDYVGLLKKKKTILEIHVTLCAIREGTENTTDKGGRLNTSSYLAIIFNNLSIIMPLDHADRHFREVKKSGEECGRVFEHMTTQYVDLISCPKTSRLNAGSVLLSLTKNYISLCDTKKPHPLLTGWSAKQLTSISQDDSGLSLRIDPEGTYKFRSNRQSVYHELENLGRQLKPTCTRSLPPIPNTGPADIPSIYLHNDPLPPNPYENTDNTCVESRANQVGYSQIQNEYLQMKPYDHDVNEFVRDHQEEYSYIISHSIEVGDVGTYLTPIELHANRSGNHSQPGSATYQPVPTQTPSQACLRDHTPTIYEQLSRLRIQSEYHGDTTHDHPWANDHEKQIFFTIDRAFGCAPPSIDTLCLEPIKRSALCVMLLQKSSQMAGSDIECWQILGEKIGLTYEAVTWIESVVRNHCLGYSAAEFVLRHWQYVYNKFGVSQPEKCPIPCTKKHLEQLIRDIGRYDILESIFNLES